MGHQERPGGDPEHPLSLTATPSSAEGCKSLLGRTGQQGPELSVPPGQDGGHCSPP